MTRRIKEFSAGDTVKVTWINSGVTVSSSYVVTYNGSETLIDSGTLTSSGNGHYYRFVTLPDSVEDYYQMKITAVVDNRPSVRRHRMKTTLNEVN